MRVYTIGRKDLYDHDLITKVGVNKIGRNDERMKEHRPIYLGGVIWTKLEWAEAFLDKQEPPRHIDFGQGAVLCDVYGVEIRDERYLDTRPLDKRLDEHALFLLETSPLHFKSEEARSAAEADLMAGLEF